MKWEKEIRQQQDWRVFDVGESCMLLKLDASLVCEQVKLESALWRVDRPRRSIPPPAAHRRTLELVEMRNGAAHKLCQELHTSTQSKDLHQKRSGKHQNGAAESAPAARLVHRWKVGLVETTSCKLCLQIATAFFQWWKIIRVLNVPYT